MQTRKHQLEKARFRVTGPPKWAPHRPEGRRRHARWLAYEQAKALPRLGDVGHEQRVGEEEVDGRHRRGAVRAKRRTCHVEDADVSAGRHAPAAGLLEERDVEAGEGERLDDEDAPAEEEGDGRGAEARARCGLKRNATKMKGHAIMN